MNFQEFFTSTPWWGKFLGGLFGYLTGGSAGAFFGVLVGNFFDKGLATHFSTPHLLYHAEKKQVVQKIFFEATFSIMGHIAKADGRVSEKEIQIANTLMNEMRLNNNQKVLAKQLFNKGKQPSFNLNQVLTELQQKCKDNRELLKLFIDIQYRAAIVDGLSSKKIKSLDEIFKRFGFAPLHKQHRFYEDFNFTRNDQNQGQHQQKQQSYSSYQKQTYQSSNSSLSHAYALLEVTPDSSKKDIKRAYRRLLSKNHPDKLIAQGLPEEMIRIANEKTHKIVTAYKLISESKGW